MKILMHMCCGPCSTYPIDILRNKDIYVEGLFYNPNIHPAEEFENRKVNVKKFGEIVNLKIHYIDEFNQQKWEDFQGEEQKRCCMCYTTRLKIVAKYASEKDFDGYTTTLLVSPYQRHELIKNLGEEFAKKYGIKFYYEDFRTDFREGQRRAKEMDLYRQKYCGCIISFRDRQSKLNNRHNAKNN